MSPYPDLIDIPYSSFEVDISPSTVFLPLTDKIPHLVSDGYSFYEAQALFPSLGPPMTHFNMGTPSPSQQSTSSLPEPDQSQGHWEMASGTSTFSLALPNTDCVPSSPSTTSIDELPEFQTEDELRTRLDQHIRSTGWFRNHEPEPTVGGPGVPKWAIHLALHGRSVYECFVKTAREKGSIIYKCSSNGCKFKSPRLRRVVGHQRKKRHHKPFACKAHPNCTFRGHTIDNMTDHCSPRNATVNCEKCGDPIVKKNMKRHLNDVHRLR